MAFAIRPRDLNMDEAAVALNILRRSWLGLASPLEHAQASPLLHLWMCKASAMVLGPTEFALRLPALAAGLASMLLFPFLARRVVNAQAALLATILFAVLPLAVVYSAEVKSYELDALATTMLLLLAVRWHDRPTLFRLLALIVAGAIATWASYASIFVLGGIGIVLFADLARQRKMRELLQLVLTGAIWIASFAGMWFAVARAQSHDPVFEAFWRNAFLPLFPRSPTQLGVLVYHFYHLFEAQFYSRYGHPRAALMPFSASLGALLFVLGIGELWRSRRLSLWMLLTPLLLAAVASWLHKYPFRLRFLLFAAPTLVLLMSVGAEWIAEALRAQRRPILAWAAPALLLIIALTNTAQLIVRVTPPEEVHAATRYIAQHMQPGDTILVEDWAAAEFDYYRTYFADCRLTDAVIAKTDGALDATKAYENFQQFNGRPRVWYLFFHDWPVTDEPTVNAAMLSEPSVTQRASFDGGSTRAMLFDLSRRSDATTSTTQSAK
jgi:4-amino-4-deoxy-L-arabinose transferase-like glycosyltransferase